MFLTKRPNGIYNIVYFKSDGKRTTKSTNTTQKTIAQKYLNLFQEQQLDILISKVTPITLEKYRWEYLKYSESIHTWKTTKAFVSTFKYFMKYFGGSVQLADLTVKKVEEYLQNRIRTTSIYSARKDHINLSSAFSKAVKDGYILSNPFKQIKKPRLPERLPLFFSDEEYEIFLNCIDREDLKDVTIFAVNTGLRQAEITSLRWSQIDFHNKHLILDNRAHITKSKRIRTIPLNVTAYSIVSKRMESRKSEFVFTFSGDLYPKR